MQSKQESANTLESLLSSLIKMVGKTNERMDQLDKRIQQIEWVLHETHLVTHESDGKRLYTFLNGKKVK